MGLGSEWSERWCVVMPRFPSVAAPANQQLTRSLLVIYKVCQPLPAILPPKSTFCLNGANSAEFDTANLGRAGRLADFYNSSTDMQILKVNYSQGCLCSTGRA